MEFVRELETGTKLPSTDPLARILLTWDFHGDVTDDRKLDAKDEETLLNKSVKAAAIVAGKTTEAVLSPRSASSLQLELKELPARFTSEEQYVNCLLPLLLLEAKQQIQRAKEMEISEPEIVVQSGAEAVGCFIQLTLNRAEVLGTTSFFNSDLCLLYLDPPEGDCEEEGGDAEQVATDLSGGGAGKGGAEASAESSKSQPKRRRWRNGIPPLNDPTTTLGLSPLVPNPFTILCIVDSCIRGILVVKVVIPPVSRTNERDVKRLTAIAKAINAPSQRWYLARVMGMSTINREYQALMSLPDLRLKDDILLTGEDPILEATKSLQLVEEQIKWVDKLPPATRRPQLKKLLAMEAKRKRRIAQLRQRAAAETKPTLEIPQKLTETLEALYNESQMAALRDCLKTEGITLIQGPPGTGKTTTIIGVLSVILNAQVKHVRKQGTARETTTSSTDVEANASEAAAEFARNMEQAQPWLYNPNYKVWYDEVRLNSEDCEVFRYVRAEKSDALVPLSRADFEEQPQKVLVCAPSNAAVDEILRRLTRDPELGGGVFDEKGERYTPSVIRVGPNVHGDLMAYSIETRAQARIQALGSATAAAREGIKMKVLSEACIVCSTLSVCGSREMISFPGEFDTVVIDEASQGIEISTLLPLRLGCRRLILVGDPKQLPATVFSRLALQYGYDQSLFQRLEKAGQRVNMLSVQYRMHPQISAFPSMAFYDGKLLDAPNIEAMVTPPVPWHPVPMFKPVTFFSLTTEHSASSSSLLNHDEAAFAVQLVGLVRLMYQSLPQPDANWTNRVAVISPYAEQVRLIRQLLKAYLEVPQGTLCPVDVNTVDGFQGREKDLVIFSAVRSQILGDVEDIPEAELKTNVGFLADVRRMNVALTRARYNLWVLGNARFLRGNPEWNRFIVYAEKHKSLFPVNYERTPRDGFVKRWLNAYLKRAVDHRALLAQHVPKFVETLEREVLMMADAGNIGAAAHSATMQD